MKRSDWYQGIYNSVKDNPIYLTERIMVQIGELIYSRMKEKNLSQRDLAAKLNKKQPFISRFLGDGGNTTIKTLVTIAQALDLSVEIKLLDKALATSENYEFEYGDYELITASDWELKTKTISKPSIQEKANAEQDPVATAA